MSVNVRRRDGKISVEYDLDASTISIALTDAEARELIAALTAAIDTTPAEKSRDLLRTDEWASYQGWEVADGNGGHYGRNSGLPGTVRVYSQPGRRSTIVAEFAPSGLLRSAWWLGGGYLHDPADKVHVRRAKLDHALTTL